MNLRHSRVVSTKVPLKVYAGARRRLLRDGRCIVISAMPKSGSTFLSNALARITGFRHGYAASDYFNLEQELYLPRLIDLYGSGAVIQQHFKANHPNLEMLDAFGLRVVVQVRDIFDVIVSVRDHLLQEDLGNVPALYPPVGFRDLSPEQQFDYLVDFAAPWHVSYFASWYQAAPSARVPVHWVTYERACADWTGQVHEVLEFCGLRYPLAHVADVVDGMQGVRGMVTRLNVGVTGRGRTMMTDEQRSRVRRLTTLYPEVDFTMIGVAPEDP